ncbi:hypothetical protein ACIBHY_35165 [Nonomuraea sp. NPDC050547]|uniref:hypothetical protein n=1 Tax=Nonomuraea sp. NPDC050547 TaxID=3364368 RepID=UPI0037AA398C
MNLRLIPAAAAMLLALAACGSTSATTGTGATTAGASASPSGNARDAQLKFAQCMRENGVEMDDPAEDGRIQFKVGQGTDRSKVEKAQKECQKHLKGVMGDQGGAMDPKRRDQMVKFAQCMRENGINVPDPTANGGIMMTGGPGDEEKMKKAQEACKKFQPGAEKQS